MGRVDADPDPDPTFHFDADPDSDPDLSTFPGPDRQALDAVACGPRSSKKTLIRPDPQTDPQHGFIYDNNLSKKYLITYLFGVINEQNHLVLM